MDDIFVYYVDFPDNVKEMVTPCYDGYTIYINKKLPGETRRRAYNHAISHVINNDFNGWDVQSIEAKAHKEV